MKNILFIAFLAFILTSCFENNDPGPLQSQEKEYTVFDFERLDIGDAMDVTVQQGSTFSVKVNGDRRNIDDLLVQTNGNTLRMHFSNSRRPRNRRYTTYVIITMPVLKGVQFSGAVTSRISGFQSDNEFDVNLSGASQLDISGATGDLRATVSGASELRAFNLQTTTATVDASGASKIKVSPVQKLNATASGASDIRYRGTPVVNVSSSGASSVGMD